MTGGTKKTAPAKNISYADFFAQVLAGLGIHGPTAVKAQSGLADVVVEEGTNSYFNPFNIEYHAGDPNTAYKGTHAINSVGVQAYASAQQGIDATVAFLQDNSNWQPLINALKTGDKSRIDNAFQGIYTWGNHFANGMNVSTNTDANILASNLGTSSVDVHPPNAGERVATDIGNVASGAKNAITSVPKLIEWFTKSDNLIRVGFIVLGLFVLLIGIDKLSGGGITGTSGGGTPTETLDVVVGNKSGNTRTAAGRATAAPAKAVRSTTARGEHGASTAKNTATTAPKRTVEHTAKDAAPAAE